MATSCRSLLIQSHGVRGTLYRVDEYLLLKGDDEEIVIQAMEYFAIVHCNKCYSFVKGKVFQPQGNCHEYSGNMFVLPTTREVTFSSCNVLRKLMLYPDPENIDSPSCYVVIDYLRPKLPITLDEVIIPVYPKQGDMVNVRGDNDDLWFAHVLLSDDRSKACKVHFYVEDPVGCGKYRRESLGRHAVETIMWDSILKLATGHWCDNYWSIQ